MVKQINNKFFLNGIAIKKKKFKNMYNKMYDSYLLMSLPPFDKNYRLLFPSLLLLLTTYRPFSVSKIQV